MEPQSADIALLSIKVGLSGFVSSFFSSPFYSLSSSWLDCYINNLFIAEIHTVRGEEVQIL